MFKNLKIGVCVFGLLALAFTPSAHAVPTWPVFHNGNTLIKGKLNVTDQIVFTGGRTVMETLMPGDILLEPGNPPTATVTTGGTGNVWQVLQFDADGGSTGDDHIQFPWVVPDGYVADSLRFNIFWSCESAETILDTVTFDGKVLSAGSSETVDTTATAMTTVTDIQWSGEADKVFKTVMNPEVVTLTIGDVLYTDINIDESESMFTDSVDIHAIQREWESTE